MNLIMPKEIRINVRTNEEIKREIEITARLRGLTVSSLINFLAVQTIREEKEREPHAFNLQNFEGRELATSSKKKIPLITSGADEERKAA